MSVTFSSNCPLRIRQTESPVEPARLVNSPVLDTLQEPCLPPQGALQATNQNVRLEGLAKKADRPTCKGLSLQIHIVARRDHDHGHRALNCREVLFELYAAHTRHLDIRNDAGKVPHDPACEEFLGRGEATGFVTRRTDQRHNSTAHGFIVVYDSN